MKYTTFVQLSINIIIIYFILVFIQILKKNVHKIYILRNGDILIKIVIQIECSILKSFEFTIYKQVRALI